MIQNYKIKSHFERFIRNCCTAREWTPLDIFCVAFNDYCKWYLNTTDIIDKTGIIELLKDSEGQIQGTCECPIVVGLTIQTWLKFPSCIHCSKTIETSNAEISLKVKDKQMSFCSNACVEDSGFMDIYADLQNDEEFFAWEHAQFDEPI